MKKILVVEDNKFFRTTLVEVLEEKFKVAEAKNGQVAQEMLNREIFDLVLSDMKMPQFDGYRLLAWVKENKPTRFMLMTGFADIFETTSASDLGADEFIAKPFKFEVLIEKIENLFKKKVAEPKATDFEKDDPRYCRLSIDDFVSDKDVAIDLFVRLSEEKFVKIVHKGGKLPEETVSKYKSKGINQLYIRREDLKKVMEFNLKLSKVVAKNSSIPEEKRKRFLANTSEIILKRTFSEGLNEDSFNGAKEFLETSVEVLAQDEETFNLLESLNEHTDYLYAHSLGVSMFSVMIAKQLDWVSSMNIFKVSLGGLMHDIGKKELSPELLEKPRNMLTHKERKEIETHTARGKAILESMRSIPSEVVAMAYQHHENCLGQGFPLQLGKYKIHPMAKVVSVANDFCNYALEGPHNSAVPGRHAIQMMEEFKADGLDRESFQALKKLFIS